MIRGRFVVACLAAALLVGALGMAGGAGRAESPGTPLYGMVAYGRTDLARATHAALTRLDPATLRAVGRKLPVGDSLSALRSPDGRSALLANDPSPRVRIVDLPTLTIRRTVTLPGTGWRVNPSTIGWLTADRVVLIQQRNRGAYHQIVGERRVVVVDPQAGRVIAVRPFTDVRALDEARTAGGRIVLMLGGQRGHSGRVGLAVVDANGRARSTDVVLGPAPGRFSPALTIDPAGSRALLLWAGSPVADVDLSTLAVARHDVTGGGRVFAGTPGWAGRMAVWLDDTTVAVTGSNSSESHTFETQVPAGLALLDTATWRAKTIDDRATSVQVSGSTMLVTGNAIGVVDRHQGNVGIGVRAYDTSGHLVWQRYAGKPVYAGAVRNVVIAQVLGAHPWPPPGPGGDLLSLGDGSRLGAAPARVYALPDPPGVHRRMAAAPASDPALSVSGTGTSFTATVRDDVTRVVAVHVDGSEEELAPDNGTLAFTAQTPDDSVRELRAYAGDQVLSDVTLAATCGGALGPCGATTPVASVPEYAFFNQGTMWRLARIDPRTLYPLGRQLWLPAAFAPSYGRSPDGRYLALGDSQHPAVRIIDLGRMLITRVIQLGGSALPRGVAWLGADRVVVLVQRTSEPTHRYVRERTFVFVDPQSGRVVSRQSISPKLALHGWATSGGRLVILLRSSEGKGTTNKLVVADADGRVRTRLVEVGRRKGGALRYSGLALEPSGRRAFIVRPGLDEPTPPVIAIDLSTLAATQHALRIGAVQSGPLRAFSTDGPITAVDDHQLLAGSVVSTGAGAGGQILPAPGLFSIDTDTWAATQIDPRATYFSARDGRIVTYGTTGDPRRGTGIRVYDDAGTELGHLYDGRTVPYGRLVLAGNYGHVLTSSPRAKRLVFNVRSAQAAGTFPHLRRYIVILDRPPQAAPARRAPASATRTGLDNEPRAFDRPARPGDRMPGWFGGHFGRITESRRIASAVRGRLHADLYVMKTSKGLTCVQLVARGYGGGCGPTPLFRANARVDAGEGSQFLNGIAADEVTRVVVDRYRGPRVNVPLSADNGFLFDCHPYDHHNGCACVVEWVDAYAGNTRVEHQHWLAPVCPYKKRR